MTLQFNCPKCKALIAFADQHAGKRAKCTTCGQRLVIPCESFIRPATVAEEPEDPGDPIPGFYRAAFAQGGAIFIRAGNAVPLVFVTAVVAFKFFIAHVDYTFTVGGFTAHLPFGLVVRGICWGCLFWYYLEIVNNTVLSEDSCALPEIEIDGYSEFFANAIRSVWVFALALLICVLPASLLATFLGGAWAGLLSTILVSIGLFVFPMLVLALGVSRDSQILIRIDLMVPPILKAFLPYVAVALLIAILVQLQFRAKNYGDSDVIHAGLMVKAGWLAAQIGLQGLALLAARALGLLHHHFACFFRW